MKYIFIFAFTLSTFSPAFSSDDPSDRPSQRPMTRQQFRDDRDERLYERAVAGNRKIQDLEGDVDAATNSHGACPLAFVVLQGLKADAEKDRKDAKGPDPKQDRAKPSK